MKNLALRIFTSTVLIGATAYFLFAKSPFWFGLEVVIFCGLCAFEFLTLLRDAKIQCYRLFGVAMSMIIPTIVLMEWGTTASGEVLFLVLACLFLFVLQFFRKDNSQALVGIALTLFVILYVSWFLSFMIKIRFLENGAFWVAYVIAVTKSADIGAYLIGSSMGKHSLIKHVSPKKTVEGTIGGLLASTVVSILFKPYLPLDFTVIHLAITGFLFAVVGQIGDLSESLMKRFCNAKDSGNILPGMGGFLDAVDSILFTAPIFYFHLKIYL